MRLLTVRAAMISRSPLRLSLYSLVHILRAKSQKNVNRTIEFTSQASRGTGLRVGHRAVRGLNNPLVRIFGAPLLTCFAFRREIAA